MKTPLLLILLATQLIAYSQKFKNPSSDNPGNADQRGPDYRTLVSRADLIYDKPAERSESGMPTGNGRMGSLVWTSPKSIKMQINRVDVFGMNKATNSFNKRSSDYASGCGYVDINMLNYGDDIFNGESFSQHLGLYDGLMTVKGRDLSARILAWHEKDVMAIEINDQRKTSVPVNIDLRMLRYMMQYHPGENYPLAKKHAVKVQTVEQTATSQLDIRNGRIVLTQKFGEKEFYSSSAVAISIVNRESQARYLNELTVQLTGKPGKGKFTILIASASSFDPEQDVADLALKELILAEEKTFEGLLSSNKTWWHDFWSKSFIQLHSEDGVADYVEENYTYFQYIMASSSQGLFPPRYGGMLWYTNGDFRIWGSQYWWYNQSCYYNSLPPTNRMEVMEPLFSMYRRNYDSYALAARQQWGSKGIWLPETTYFDGLEELPEDIAAEMRDLYLVRKPWKERTERFRRYAESKNPFSSSWNWAGYGSWDKGHWIIPDKGFGPFGDVTHMLSPTAEIAFLYWLRYEYSQDKKWLSEYAYPMIKGAVEFYRNFPNVRKESDGKYHIYHTNSWEYNWDGHNSFKDISAMHGLTPVLIRASEILGIDADMRPIWQEFADNIAPLPTNNVLSSWKEGQPRYWIGSLPPTSRYSEEPDSPWSHLGSLFDICTIGTEDKGVIRTGNSTIDAIYKGGVNEHTPICTLNQNALMAAFLGRANDLKHMIPNQIKSLNCEIDFIDIKGSGDAGILPNRLTLREGPGSMDCQRIGNASTALHAALLQSVPPKPGGKPVIYLFPAWPQEWDASYKLLARGAFLVSSTIKKGKIEYVTIESKSGGECLIKNPWPGGTLSLLKSDKEVIQISGDILTFSMTPGEAITLVKK